MLLTDIEIKSTLQVIEEGSAKNNHCPKVRGLFQRADEANQNKRVYPHSILENQVKKLQPLIKERRLCGELDHPQNDTVRLLNASHLVTKLWMEGSEVYGNIDPKYLKAMSLIMADNKSATEDRYISCQVVCES